MSGDFKNYSSVQETWISTLAKKQIHSNGKRGESHFLGGERGNAMEQTHPLGCSGTCYRGKVNCVFLNQYEVFKVTVKWMFTPAGHHFSLLPGAFSSRNQILKTPFGLPVWRLPYSDIFHLFSVSSPQVFSSFFQLFTSLLMSPSTTQWGPGTTFSQFSQPSSRWDTPGQIMYQRPEKPSFEVKEFSAIYPSSFYPNRTEHLSCNNSHNGLIKEEILLFSRKAELSKVLLSNGRRL